MGAIIAVLSTTRIMAISIKNTVCFNKIAKTCPQTASCRMALEGGQKRSAPDIPVRPV